MAYSQSDVDALEKAIARGELRVRLLDREVTYRSLEELTQAHRFVKNQVSATPGPRFQLADFSESDT
jgi:hypothetical protein